MATPPNLLLLTGGAELARLFLQLFVALRDLLRERRERRRRCRPARSGLQFRFVWLLRHSDHLLLSLPTKVGHRTNARARHRAVVTAVHYRPRTGTFEKLAGVR